MKNLLCSLALVASFVASPLLASSWDKIEQAASGQQVFFHAWGGSQEVNRYLQWANQELQSRYNLTLVHVKVTDISETLSRLVAEKAMGRDQSGSVDLVWINGENFKSMKDNDLLFGPFVEQLPNWQYVDRTLPVETDFSEPTEGLEAPWGLGQFVYIYDPSEFEQPPRSAEQWLAYARAHPNRLTYPRPPEFHGISFLKSLLIELTDNHKALSQPVDPETFEDVSAPLWNYLDEFHQVAWRGGRQFASGTAEMIQLLDDRQIDLAMTFNPNAVFSAQANGTLDESTQVYAFESGALTNVHFLAIPWNASATAGAQVAINFLLSPQAQSRKGDTRLWGDPSVLEQQYLTGTARQTRRFNAISEPHPSWQKALEAQWLARYGSR